MNLLFNIFSSNLDYRNLKSNNRQLAQQNAKLNIDLRDLDQRHGKLGVKYTELQMSWSHRGVSNFRFYEGASLFDFIRPWLTSFGNTVGVILQQNM